MAQVFLQVSNFFW